MLDFNLLCATLIEKPESVKLGGGLDFFFHIIFSADKMKVCVFYLLDVFV